MQVRCVAHPHPPPVVSPGNTAREKAAITISCNHLRFYYPSCTQTHAPLLVLQKRRLIFDTSDKENSQPRTDSRLAAAAAAAAAARAPHSTFPPKAMAVWTARVADALPLPLLFHPSPTKALGHPVPGTLSSDTSSTDAMPSTAGAKHFSDNSSTSSSSSVPLATPEKFGARITAGLAALFDRHLSPRAPAQGVVGPLPHLHTLRSTGVWQRLGWKRWESRRRESVEAEGDDDKRSSSPARRAAVNIASDGDAAGRNAAPAMLAAAEGAAREVTPRREEAGRAVPVASPVVDVKVWEDTTTVDEGLEGGFAAPPAASGACSPPPEVSPAAFANAEYVAGPHPAAGVAAGVAAGEGTCFQPIVFGAVEVGSSAPVYAADCAGPSAGAPPQSPGGFDGGAPVAVRAAASATDSVAESASAPLAGGTRVAANGEGEWLGPGDAMPPAGPLSSSRWHLGARLLAVAARAGLLPAQHGGPAADGAAACPTAGEGVPPWLQGFNNWCVEMDAGMCTCIYLMQSTRNPLSRSSHLICMARMAHLDASPRPAILAW